MSDKKLVTFVESIMENIEEGNSYEEDLKTCMKKLDVKKTQILMQKLKEISDERAILLTGLFDYILENYND